MVGEQSEHRQEGATMSDNFIQANIKESETVTTHQIVPNIDNPHIVWEGSAPEATATVDYLKRRAPATDTFTVVKGEPDPAYGPYDMRRLVERTPDDVKEKGNG
jgi:hypothetical protein